MVKNLCKWARSRSYVGNSCQVFSLLSESRSPQLLTALLFCRLVALSVVPIQFQNCTQDPVHLIWPRGLAPFPQGHVSPPLLPKLRESECKGSCGRHNRQTARQQAWSRYTCLSSLNKLEYPRGCGPTNTPAPPHPRQNHPSSVQGVLEGSLCLTHNKDS